jgi:hypothetical protein
MASIKCAHCKGTHNTVAQVKLCSVRQARAKAQDGWAAGLRRDGAAPALEENFNEVWAQYKQEAADREAAEERAGYEAEMRRDEMLADGLEYGIGPMR